MPQTQVQQQKLTQEQIQLQTAMQVLASRLVELPLDGLRERVEAELAENPYLEASNSDSGDGYIQDEGGGSSSSDYDARKDYSTEDDIPDYLLQQHSGTEAESMDSADTQSFYDQMMEQVAGCESEMSFAACSASAALLRHSVGRFDRSPRYWMRLPFACIPNHSGLLSLKRL